MKSRKGKKNGSLSMVGPTRIELATPTVSSKRPEVSRMPGENDEIDNIPKTPQKDGVIDRILAIEWIAGLPRIFEVPPPSDKDRCKKSVSKNTPRTRA